MKYHEYKNIISNAIIEYCNNGGSLLDMARNNPIKEYIYEFDGAYPEDMKKNLIDKAHQAMKREQDLPQGIRLVKVVFK